MNVRELKEIIKDLPDDMEVVLRVYDHRYDEYCQVQLDVVHITRDNSDEYYEKEVVELY